MKYNGDKKNDSGGPEKWRVCSKRFRIVIHDLAAKKHLQVTQHMRNEKPEKDKPGYRHDRLLADGRVIKPGDSIDVTSGYYGTHESSPTLVTKPDIVTL